MESLSRVQQRRGSEGQYFRNDLGGCQELDPKETLGLGRELAL